MSNTETLLKEVWDNIQIAESTLESGGKVDMNLLSEKTRIFCESVLNLPAADAKKYDDKMSQIIAHLSSMTDKMQENYKALGQAIDTFDRGSNAHTAYANAARLMK